MEISTIVSTFNQFVQPLTIWILKKILSVLLTYPLNILILIVPLVAISLRIIMNGVGERAINQKKEDVKRVKKRMDEEIEEVKQSIKEIQQDLQKIQLCFYSRNIKQDGEDVGSLDVDTTEIEGKERQKMMMMGDLGKSATSLIMEINTFKNPN